MINHKDRRHYPRTKIKLPVVKMAKEGLVDGEIQDLSVAGAFIRCPAMPQANDSFHMVISAKGRLISITAEMVWRDFDKLKNKNKLRGIGVRFKKIFSGDRLFLREILAKHQRNILVPWLPR
jgi:hypothetical protein